MPCKRKRELLKDLDVDVSKKNIPIGDLRDIHRARKFINKVKDENPVKIKRIKKVIKRKPRFKDLK